MNLIKKRGTGIILAALIAFVVYSIYMLGPGSKSFAVLDVNNITNLNDPALKIVVEATEECNKLEETYHYPCYQMLAWSVGQYYGESCGKLKEELKPACYKSYGVWLVNELEEKLDMDKIKEECSKTEFEQSCLLGASRELGKTYAGSTETEKCKSIQLEDVKAECYQGFGRQLAQDNKESSLCEKTENKDACLQGYAYATDKKKDRERAVQICSKLSERYAKECYYNIGIDSTWAYNEEAQKAFKNCEQHPYPEECKRGVAGGVGLKSFEEKQQKSGVFVPTA